MRHQHRIKKVVVIVDAILLLILVGFVIGLVVHQRSIKLTPPSMSQDGIEDTDAPVVYLSGTPYRAKENLTKVLLLGVDSSGEMVSSGGFENGAKCDFAALVLLDEETNSYSLLYLNRDTMTDVPQLGIGGTAGTERMQLALAYTYGDGMKDSCMNTVKAVENLLYGVPIDHYFAINMSGMEKLIDAVGGVDVTIHGDFSVVAPELVEGQRMHLDGALGMKYLRARQNIGEETNLERSQRQREFIRELLPQMEKQENLSLKLAEVASFVVTDLSANGLSDLSERMALSEFDELYTPDGEVSEEGKFIEFYPDEETLRQLVIQLFYEPVEEVE